MIAIRLQKALHGALGAFNLSIDINVEEGDFVAVYGPSGVGKTTLLRCLAGLDRPDSGSIVIADQTWLDSARQFEVPTQHRRVGYMFQDYALFPNMTVRGNVAFALCKGAPKSRADELLEMMALGELAERRPDTLSGGQKQRVALARALAAEPRILLLDEPFSALDADIRGRLHAELLQLQRRFGLTVLLVSHDVGEVYKLASRVLVMEAGTIVRAGTPAEVFSAGPTSGKFRFAGEILAITPMDVLFTLTVLVGNQIVTVVATRDEIAELVPGSRVMLVSKAFNPMVLKLA